MADIIIIYHGKCRDGFGGAWAAWKNFGETADYFPAQHSQDVLTDIKDKEVYFIDFVYPAEITRKFIQENKKVVIIDHHITAREIVKLVPDHLFDINHSGAVLAWQYFHPGKPLPRLLESIEDSDLWKFQVPYTKEIITFLTLYDFDFRLWDEFATNIKDDQKIKKYIEIGEIVLRYETSLLKDAIEDRADLVEFEGYRVLAINYPHFLASDLGSAFVKKNPPIGIIWSETKGKITVSLRSDGTVDVAKIAQKYGGGGHKTASGFSFDSDQPKPWRRILNP